MALNDAGEVAQRYRHLAETSPEGIAIHRDGRILYVNPAGVRMLGASGPEELVGGAVLDFVHPDDRAAIVERLARVSRGEAAPWLEERLVRVDGGVIDVEVSAAPVPYGDGGSAVQVIFRDITERKRIEGMIKEGDERLRTVLATAPVILFAVDAVGTVTVCEGKALAALGFTSEQCIGHRIQDLYPERPDLLGDCRRAITGESFTHVAEVAGTLLEVHWTPRASADGSPAGAVALALDVSDRLRAHEGGERLQALIEASPFAVVECDRDLTVVAWNPAAERLFGWTVAEVIGRVGPDVPGEMLDEMRVGQRRVMEADEPMSFETVRERKDRTPVPLAVTVAPLHDPTGRVSGALSIVVERGGTLEAQTELGRLTRFDRATGLPDHETLLARLGTRIDSDARSPIALLNVDIDEFKELRSSLGEELAEAVVRDMARRLETALRGVDTLARTGDDDFSVLLAGTVAPDDAIETAQRLLGACRAPYAIDGRSISALASVGVALFPEDGSTADELLRAARLAQAEARRTGAGCARSSSALRARAETWVAVTGDLGRAIERGELVLHYQPLVSLTKDLVLGAEALVRWAHPTRGLIMPADFVPLVEESPHMLALTRRVLEGALTEYRRWHARGSALPVLVNVTARDLRDPAFALLIEDLARRYRVSSKWLKLEITERVALADPERTIATLQRLRALGILIALDDFGTGYSSLAYLARLPVDAVKIDRSFIAQLATDERTRAIVAATVGLAHSLGFGVVAEGVEDPATLELLRRIGCDMAQGFHIARPMLPAALDAWLSTAPWKPRHTLKRSRTAACATTRGTQRAPL